MRYATAVTGAPMCRTSKPTPSSCPPISSDRAGPVGWADGDGLVPAAPLAAVDGCGVVGVNAMKGDSLDEDAGVLADCVLGEGGFTGVNGESLDEDVAAFPGCAAGEEGLTGVKGDWLGDGSVVGGAEFDAVGATGAGGGGAGALGGGGA